MCIYVVIYKMVYIAHDNQEHNASRRSRVGVKGIKYLRFNTFAK